MNTHYSKIYSISSRNDVKQAIQYLKHTLKNTAAANRLLALVEATAENIKSFPYKYPAIDDLLLAPYKIYSIKQLPSLLYSN